MKMQTRLTGFLTTALAAVSLSLPTSGCFDRDRVETAKPPVHNEQPDRDGHVLAREATPTPAPTVGVRPAPSAVDVDGATVEPIGERETVLDPARAAGIDSDAASTERADPKPTPESEDLWNGR